MVCNLNMFAQGIVVASHSRGGGARYAYACVALSKSNSHLEYEHTSDIIQVTNSQLLTCSDLPKVKLKINLSVMVEVMTPIAVKTMVEPPCQTVCR